MINSEDLKERVAWINKELKRLKTLTTPRYYELDAIRVYEIQKTQIIHYLDNN